jgi:hypothetical protein
MNGHRNLDATDMVWQAFKNLKKILHYLQVHRALIKDNTEPPTSNTFPVTSVME